MRAAGGRTLGLFSSMRAAKEATEAMRERFTEGELVNHTKFGLGVVVRVEVSKCELLFRDTPRVMVHSMSA